MAYIVKNTYEKPGADVLLEHTLGPLETLNEIFADPRVLNIEWFRSDDRSYGESYMTWESKQSYDEWHAEYQTQHTQGQQQMEQYMQQMGIEFHRIYPDHEDQDWADNQYLDPRISIHHLITYDQIFE